MHNDKIIIGFGYRIISTIIKALICLCYRPRTQTSVCVIHLGHKPRFVLYPPGTQISVRVILVGHKPRFVLSTSDTILGLCYPPRTQTSVCVIRLQHKPRFVLSVPDTNRGLDNSWHYVLPHPIIVNYQPHYKFPSKINLHVCARLVSSTSRKVRMRNCHFFYCSRMQGSQSSWLWRRNH